MIFGRRRNTEDPDPSVSRGEGEPPSEAAPAIGSTEAVDLAAELLRTFGEQSFDVGETPAASVRTFFEEWARHLLVGTPAPSHEGPVDPVKTATGTATKTKATTTATAQPAPTRRNLPGLRRSVRDHRAAEVHYVTHAIGEFREATWAFISGLRRSLSAEQSADRRISHRMRRLEGAVRSGDPVQIKSEAQETVALLTEFLAERGQRHEEQISAMAARLESLRAELDSVRAQAAIDPVTRIYNRQSFDEQIEREVDLATLFGKRGCLIMVDIDHFKWVNDTFGHPAGDHVLREMAATLNRCFKRKDDFVARYGGEEFAVVLRDLPVQTAQTVAERGMGAVRLLEIAREGLSEPIRITASMGIARLRPGETAAAWVERADRALYQAKHGGRDRIEVDPIDLEGR